MEAGTRGLCDPRAEGNGFGKAVAARVPLIRCGGAVSPWRPSGGGLLLRALAQGALSRGRHHDPTSNPKKGG